MELYLKVRRAHFQDGLSGRQIARDFGISRDSVRKMLAYSEPPAARQHMLACVRGGYRRTAEIKRPKLDAYVDQIDQWLTKDKVRPRKRRLHHRQGLRAFQETRLTRDVCAVAPSAGTCAG